MISEIRKTRSDQWVTPVLIGVMIGLVRVNYTLLEHRSELWRVLSNADFAVPSRAAVLRWDAARLILGVVLMPGLGFLLWWAVSRGPLSTWGAKTMAGFIAGVVSMAFHLRWMYEWGSERHLELPPAIVWTLTVLSLNAPLYLAAIGTFVLLRRLWLSHQRNHERHA